MSTNRERTADAGQPTTILTHEVGSPIGTIVLYTRESVLCALAFDEERATTKRALERRFGPVSLRAEPAPGDLERRLEAYVVGELGAVEDIVVETGGTPFQRRVWDALRRIPAGETRSYAGLAAAIGAPTATRAVGAANGRNPIPIVIPCHRVVASDGGLGGFSSGLPRKRWLLAHEMVGSGLALV